MRFFKNRFSPVFSTRQKTKLNLVSLPPSLSLFSSLFLLHPRHTKNSMGGHGALVLGLRRPDLFCSVSALAPICNPSVVPWGVKAFSSYFGGEKEAAKGGEIPESWRSHDACELLKAYAGPARSILVDYGSADEFLEAQLKPLSLEEAAKAPSSKGAVTLVVREQKGYDHSYYFIASFIDDHVEHAARALLKKA